MSRDMAWLFILAALWGGSFLFMRIAVPVMGPFPLIALRVGIAALALLPWLLWHKDGWELLRKNWRPIATVGIVISAIPFCLIAWASLSLPAGTAAILNATTPFMTTLWAMCLTESVITRKTIIGLSLGFLGVLVMTVEHNSQLNALAILPVIAMLSAAACYGWAGHAVKRHFSRLPPIVSTTGGMLSGAILLCPLAWNDWPANPISSTIWVAVMTLALASTALAYLIFYRLIERLGAIRASSVTYLVPAFGVIFGHLLLGEPITLPIVLSGLLILSGVALLNYPMRSQTARG